MAQASTAETDAAVAAAGEEGEWSAARSSHVEKGDPFALVAPQADARAPGRGMKSKQQPAISKNSMKYYQHGMYRMMKNKNN